MTDHMKKHYETPGTEVLEIETGTKILDGSANGENMITNDLGTAKVLGD